MILYTGKIMLATFAVLVVVWCAEANRFKYKKLGRGSSSSKSIIKKFKDSRRLGKLGSWSLQEILLTMSLAGSMYLLDNLEKMTNTDDEDTLRWIQEQREIYKRSLETDYGPFYISGSILYGMIVICGGGCCMRKKRRLYVAGSVSVDGEMIQHVGMAGEHGHESDNDSDENDHEV